ncbi:GntR family transcriptional regulator [Acidimangrovimonas pyrenivorans]|uniref:GntR family transcriptional regulator n=1 Tax=Acidimangrovimonas pyrenivorans TaxID=2030798 RepID=A0ABV7AG09_9RHOB
MSEKKASPHFAPLARDALSQRIARLLTDAIVSGQLKPGDRVAESVVARDLGVSRAPVREAARLLESTGLLVSQPNRGFFVRTVTAEDLDSLYELRICIEREAAARLVRAGAQHEVIPQLRRQIEEMLALSAQEQLFDQVVVDLEFHRLICAASGNSRFLAVFEQIASEIRACVALIERMLYDEPGQIAQNHYLIIDALETGDEAEVRAAMDYHIGVARATVVARFRELERDGEAASSA